MAAKVSDYDLQVYEREILPYLPPEVVDAHVLLGLREHFREVPSAEREAPELGVRHHLTLQGLFSNFRQILRYRRRRFVALPFPYRGVDAEAANLYVVEGTSKRSLRALVMLDEKGSAGLEGLLSLPGVAGVVASIGRDMGRLLDGSLDDLLALLAQSGGALVLFPSEGGSVTDERSVEAVLSLASRHPSLNIVLARAGGALCPGEAERAVPRLSEAPNVLFDTAFVTSHKVLEILFSLAGAERVLFGSGAPYSFYRGYVACPGGYGKLVILGRGGERHVPRSRSDTLLIYNILRAILRAARACKIGSEGLSAILCDNAMRVYFGAG